jgi:hypothetical protein
MALGATPTLNQIKTELGSSNNSLSCFISEAGKTGIWNKQSDFAYYSAASICANPSYLDFNNFDLWKYSTITSSPYSWNLELVPYWLTVCPSTGSAGNTTLCVRPDRNLGGSPRFGTIYICQATSNCCTTINVSQGACGM